MSFPHTFYRWFILPVSLHTLALAQNSVELRQAFRDLSNPTVAMGLSAHPDDEDGSTLAYLRMRLGVKTYSVLFTRGEGGQNEKGPELYEKLGVLRSRETEEAGKLLGAEVRFLNFMDFGYSKTSPETFQKWGGSREVLRRLVYVIRKYKPDVLFTNHNTIDGHGNHQAVAVTAIAAFDAAADSTIFPEQLKEPGITAWQPRKLFFRVRGDTESRADVVNSIGETDSLRGVSYVDIATEALRQHRTQGMERANLRSWSRGKSFYKLMRSNSLYEPDSTSFFSGIDVWRDPEIRPLSPVWKELALWHPEMGRDSLLRSASRSLGRLSGYAPQSRLSPLTLRMAEHWRTEIERIVALTCGIRASLVPADTVVVAQQQVACSLRFDHGECPVADVVVTSALPPNSAMDFQTDPSSPPGQKALGSEFTMLASGHLLPTLPAEVAQYNSLERHQDLIVNVAYALDRLPMSLRLSSSVDVAPPQWLEISPPTASFLPRQSKNGLTFSWKLTNYLKSAVSGLLTVEAPQGWTSTRAGFDDLREDDTASGRINVQPPPGVKPGEYLLKFRGAQATVAVPVNVFDVKVAQDLRLGIIISYDNTLEAATKALGVSYELVKDTDIENGDLDRFTSIILDIRAYLVRDALKKFNNRLLDYARKGGNLIVMYQRDQEWKQEHAPFPFQVTRKRVTVEEAPIAMLAPDHPLLSFPNRISERDWGGWKQERAVYLPGDVPSEYTRLLSTGDPDEEQVDTGYLVARVGRGSYIYTSFVWYRQLKEENPGAFRCFANMISYSSSRN